MLHLLNGDSTLQSLKQSDVPGEMLSWREALIAGPTPHRLPLQQWIDVRARHLAVAYGVGLEDCRKDLSLLYSGLQGFAQHDEVVLWFEHDLFCQVNLLHVLDWFAKQSPGKTRLSLICIDAFPGKPDFRGLGELTPAQLASLFDQRREVTVAEKQLAAEAWAAYASSSPLGLVALLENDCSALPFLGAALAKHLARFPSVRNGLGNIETKALELIAAGAHEFQALFPRFGTAEPLYGLGDAQLWNDLQRLIKAKHPLLRAQYPEAAKEAPGNGTPFKASFMLTDAGHAVLAGQSDFIALNGIDLWLGGVHLRPGNVWRWDEESRALAFSE